MTTVVGTTIAQERDLVLTVCFAKKSNCQKKIEMSKIKIKRNLRATEVTNFELNFLLLLHSICKLEEQ